MKTNIIVQNLKCNGCVKTITSEIQLIEGITDVVVDLESSVISFNYKDPVNALSVKQRLKALGYPSIDENNSIISKAKSMVSCATGKIKNQ